MRFAHVLTRGLPARRPSLVVLLSLGVVPVGVSAQDPGRLSGRVIADENARPLGLAQVTISSLNIGT